MGKRKKIIDPLNDLFDYQKDTRTSEHSRVQAPRHASTQTPEHSRVRTPGRKKKPINDMSKRKDDNLKRATFYVEKEFLIALKILSAETECDQSDLVNEAIKRELKRRKKI